MSQSYQKYYKTNVETSDQISLIVMLYDGFIRFNKKAIHCAKTNDIEGSHNYLTRCKDIVNELLSTLKVDDINPVANNLRDLYIYIYRKLVEANLRKDTAIMVEVLNLMVTLKQGWSEIKNQQKKQKAPANRDLNKKFNAQG